MNKQFHALTKIAPALTKIAPASFQNETLKEVVPQKETLKGEHLLLQSID